MAIEKPKKEKDPVPVSVVVRTYNVGLGDCFLLTFKTQSESKFHEHRILIDFGSTGRNKLDGPNLKQVADQIVQDCGGKNSTIDAVVITHRHQDHMSGFKGKSGHTLVSQLRPKVIFQPWTENPKAVDPPQNSTTSEEKNAAQYVLNLNDSQNVTESILKEIQVRREKGMGRSSDEEAVFYCQKNLPFAKNRSSEKTSKSAKEDNPDWENIDKLTNFEAIENIQNWSWQKAKKLGRPKFEYLQKDEKFQLPIPGLNVKVLGPVGPKQWELLKKHANNDELWKKLNSLKNDSHQIGSPADDSEYVKFDAEIGPYGVESIFQDDDLVVDSEDRKDNVRWLIENLDELRGQQLLSFVRTLDEHINNTSLVLLFEFGGFRMLFPGDAEVASWQAIAEDGKVDSELKQVNLYKVGHHGSNNATPKKSLWEKMLEHRDKDHPLHCVLSTQTTKFSGSIPNKTLLNEMLDSDLLHLVSTAYFDDTEASKHSADWKVHTTGTGNKRIVMSYSREFKL